MAAPKQQASSQRLAAEKARPSRRSGAESARKVLELLLRFSDERPAASIRELASETGVPLPTAYRYVALLREMGLVEEGDRGRYHVTPRVAPLARAAYANPGLIRIAEPVMRRLADTTRESVILVRLIGGLPVCVDRVESPHRV